MEKIWPLAKDEDTKKIARERYLSKEGDFQLPKHKYDFSHENKMLDDRVFKAIERYSPEIDLTQELENSEFRLIQILNSRRKRQNKGD